VRSSSTVVVVLSSLSVDGDGVADGSLAGGVVGSPSADAGSAGESTAGVDGDSVVMSSTTQLASSLGSTGLAASASSPEAVAVSALSAPPAVEP
jgi:hypothetical protein